MFRLCSTVFDCARLRLIVFDFSLGFSELKAEYIEFRSTALFSDNSNLLAPQFPIKYSLAASKARISEVKTIFPKPG